MTKRFRARIQIVLLLACIGGCNQEPSAVIGQWVQLDASGRAKVVVAISTGNVKVYVPGDDRESSSPPVYYKNQVLRLRWNFNAELSSTSITVLLRDDTEPVTRIPHEFRVSEDTGGLTIREKSHYSYIPPGDYHML